MSTTQLKLFALAAMFIDHVGQFIPHTPEWFHWIGRIAIPIFIYAVVIGYQYTSNQKKYLIRLYMFSVGMSLINITLNTIYRNYDVADPTNNFFAPLFLIVLLISILEKKRLKYILLFLLWQIITFCIGVYFIEIVVFPNISDTMVTYYYWGPILGNMLFVEGGPLFVLMGVSLYFVRNKKFHLILVYTFFSFCCFYVSYKFGHIMSAWNDLLFPFAPYQWMMIAAVPLILLYNNKKGVGMKYFFYVFYPAHIIILYLIGFYLQNPPLIESGR